MEALPAELHLLHLCNSGCEARIDGLQLNAVPHPAQRVDVCRESGDLRRPRREVRVLHGSEVTCSAPADFGHDCPQLREREGGEPAKAGAVLHDLGGVGHLGAGRRVEEHHVEEKESWGVCFGCAWRTVVTVVATPKASRSPTFSVPDDK